MIYFLCLGLDFSIKQPPFDTLNSNQTFPVFDTLNPNQTFPVFCDLLFPLLNTDECNELDWFSYITNFN